MRSGNKYWKHGDKKKLAQAAGLSVSGLSDILCRRRGVSVKRASALELAAAHLGYNISKLCWLENKNTRHPGFRKV